MRSGHARLRCGLLGPLRVHRGETELTFASVPQQAMLAVLALHANRPIGRDQLIDSLWGSTPPTYAVNLVQKRMSELRTVLDPGRSPRERSQVLRWTDRGYVLALPDDGLDLWQHCHELELARGHLARGDLRGSAHALHSALDLWRGRPFEGLSSPLLDAERDRMIDARITTIEQRVELDIALGGAIDVITELRRLVAENPLRERLRELLMLALYRANRQADAVGEFHAARRCLRDELGIDPGPDLDGLYQRILRADPDLLRSAIIGDQPPGALHDEGRAAPAELPHALPSFTARTAELRRLDALIGGDAAATQMVTIAITGTAGVGKTSLALTWAHRVRELFPDGQLYVNLRGYEPSGEIVHPAQAIRGFLDSLSSRPRALPVDLAGQAALYRSMLAGRRMLVVLDNARSAEQARPLLPGTPGCVVLVTSRSQLAGLVASEGAHAVDLDLLSADEARGLLELRLGSVRVATEPLAVDQIITACARLPLALTIAAARARPQISLAAVAVELMDAQLGLDVFNGGEAMSDIRTVFSWSYDRLSTSARRVFRLLGMHPPAPDISLHAVASVAGVNVRETRGLLAELTEANLVTEQQAGRFVMHDLLRAYAGELAALEEPAAECALAARRTVDYYLHTAYAADRLLAPHREGEIEIGGPVAGVTVPDLADHAGALAWFSVEHVGLLAAARHGVDLGLDEQVWQLCWSLTHHFEYHAQWHDSVSAYSIALDAAGRLGNSRAAALIHQLLSRPYVRLSRFAEADAHLESALVYFEGVGDVGAQAHVHRLMCWVFERKGRYADALAQAARALSLYREAGSRTGEARALNAVGWFHALLGDVHSALLSCHQALALQQQIGDRNHEAETHDSIGYLYLRYADYGRSAESYLRALTIYRALGDRFDEAETLTALGDARSAAGDEVTARAAWSGALAIFDELAHPDADLVRTRLG